MSTPTTADQERRWRASVAHPARPPHADRAWTGQIEWQRVDGRARFCALARAAVEDGAEQRAQVARSPWFAWPPADPAAIRAMVDAAGVVEDMVLTAGWTPLEPGAAWYAKRFAWAAESATDVRPSRGRRLAALRPARRPAAPPAAARGRPPASPEEAAELRRCEIAWRAGYVTSRFEVLGFDPGGTDPRPIGSSAPFRWGFMADADARDAAQRGAVAGLVAALAAAGWEPVGHGAEWYAQRFVWRGADAPPALRGHPGAAGPDTGLWRCEIAWDAGYATSQFVALARAPGRRRGRPIGRSQRFRWLFMDDPDPAGGEYRDAVRRLESALLAAGWERAGRGREWYAERFVWRRDGTPPALAQ